MKSKVAIFSLLGVIIALSGCAGTQVNEKGLSGENSAKLIEETELMAFVPEVNADGTLTMFNVNQLPVKTQFLTVTGAKGRTLPVDNRQIARYQAALKDNPRNYEACIMLAGLYSASLSNGDPRNADEAITYSTMALGINKDDPYALYTRALNYYEKGEYQKALADLQMVLRLELQSVVGVYYMMGKIHSREIETDASKLNDAIKAFEVVSVFDPDFADVKNILAKLYAIRK